MRSANEHCEGDDLNSKSCVDLGYAGGELHCSSGCQFDESNCYKRRFEDLGKTVLDHQTQLEWEKKDEDAGTPELKNPHDVDNTYEWGNPDGPIGNAYTLFLAQLNGAFDGECYAARCDWRIPTIDELETIVPAPIMCLTGFCLGAIDPTMEPMKEDVYWSSTTFIGDSGEAWSGNFPAATFDPDNNKKESRYLRHASIDGAGATGAASVTGIA